MHRINIKSRKTLWLRLGAYGLTLVLSVLTTIILLFIALGYRFDGQSRQITRSGLLLVNNEPEAGSVYVDGELKDGAAPSRFVLKSGSYELSLERSGYRGWKKQLQIKPSSVKEIFYPRLIPRDIKTNTLLEIGASEVFSQSPDRKLVLLHSPNQSPRLLELDLKQPQLTTLTLPASINREAGQVGRLEVLQWALDNKRVLVKQTLPSGTVHALRLDVSQPDQSLTLANQFVNTRLDQLHFVGDSIDQLYSLDDKGVVRRHTVGGSSQVVLEGIRSYRPISDDQVLFSRLASDGSVVESGIWQDDKATVINRSPQLGGTELLALSRYEGRDYFAVGQTLGSNVQIYRDPLKKPILKNQLAYSSLPVVNPTEMSFSENGRFIMAYAGASVASYDFDELAGYQFQLGFTLSPGTKLAWNDGFHLLAFDEKLDAHLIEFDGTNQQTLVPALAPGRWLLGEASEAIYRSATEGDKTVLRASSLVASN